MIIPILHALLKPTLPEVHATRFRAVMAAVKSGLSGAKVSITALGGLFRARRISNIKSSAWTV